MGESLYLSRETEQRQRVGLVQSCRNEPVQRRDMDVLQMAKLMGNQAVVQMCGRYNPFGSDFLCGEEAEVAIDDEITKEDPYWKLIIRGMKKGQRLSYASGQVETVWNNATALGTNEKMCGACEDKGKPIRWRLGMLRTDVWDMGHIPGSEYRTYLKNFIEGKITFETFKIAYQNPACYRVEHPACNRSGKYEAG